MEPQIHTFLDNLPAISADLFKDVDNIWMKMDLGGMLLGVFCTIF